MTTSEYKFYAVKLITALAFSFFVIRTLNQLWESTALEPNLVLLLFSESITVALILLAKPARDYAMNAIAIISAGAVTFYFLVINISAGQELLPVYITASLQIIGLIFQITAKLYLGRSFGLVAANRGIVTNGPYKLVRHPIYFGYLLAHIGFLSSLFSMQNLIVFIGLYFFQGCRIWQEEKLLMKDPEYAKYAEKTRYKIIPRII